jgi:hypothetical protein
LDIAGDNNQIRISQTAGGTWSSIYPYNAAGTNIGALIWSTSQAWLESRTGDLIFGAGGVMTERMRITAGGNVGIGTTAPGQKLDVVGGYIRSDTGFCIGTSCITSWPSGGGVSGSGTTNYIAKWTGSTSLGNSIIYDNGTNVGIGTTAPGYKLDVREGSIAVLHMSGAPQILIGNGGGADTSRADIRLVDTPAAPKTLLFWGGDSTNGYQMGTFYVQATKSIFSGNVGIGTTAPGDKLSVVGTFFAGGSVSGLKINGTRLSSGYAPGMGGTGELPITIDAIGVNSTYLDLQTGGTSRIRINAYGNVGIGTTTPGYKLDVVGDIRTSGTYRVGGSAGISADLCFPCGGGFCGCDYLIVRGGIVVGINSQCGQCP